MSKLFTPEELRALRANPNVARASENRLSLTPDFLEEARTQWKAGQSPEQILRSHGLDPEVLGRGRVNWFAAQLREVPESEMAGTIRELDWRAQALRQEVAFRRSLLHPGKSPNEPDSTGGERTSRK